MTKSRAWLDYCDISGVLSLDKLRISSKNDITNLNAFNESFNSGNFAINFENKKLIFDQISLNKQFGSILGYFNFDLNNSEYNFDFNIANLLISQIDNIRPYIGTLEGNVTGGISGKGKDQIYFIKPEITISNLQNLCDGLSHVRI